MNLKGKKVLVTGAAGFIGSHLVERLVSLGCQVTAFVKYNSRTNFGNLELIPENIRKRIRIMQGDLRDSHAVRKAVKGQEVVFHLGALITIPYSYTNPKENFLTNVMGTFNVMDACLEYGIKKVVHTSTSETYGTPKRVPIREEDFPQGQSPYSASKIGADKLVESFYYSYNLPAVILRPFNTYGPRQSARAVIPNVVCQILNKNEVVVGNLHPTRDFTFVTDTVEGFIKCAENDKVIGEVINMGTGREISVKEIIEKVARILGKDVRVIVDKKRVRPEKSEILRLCADISKARTLLKWEPKVDFDNGLRFTIEWIKNNINLYKPNIYNI